MKKITLILIASIISVYSFSQQNNPHWDLSGYQPQDGLTARVSNNILLVDWAGEGDDEFHLEMTVNNGAPVIRELSVRAQNGHWNKIMVDVTPEFRIVSGTRRVTQQQTEPLEKMGVPLTPEKLDEIKWDAFWDAPLYISEEPPKSHTSSIPAEEAFANHPGMPRKASEVKRATAVFSIDSCTVRTNGSRAEIVFQGVEAGIFAGYLQFDIYKGSNLVRQMLVAKTGHPSAAFKYDAGLKGLEIQPKSRVVWRDMARHWQEYLLGGPVDNGATIIKSNNRLIAAQQQAGSIAIFPPPHRFYWARESEQNLGYSWYRKDNDNTFSFGTRQAELEQDPEYYHNFALYSARPGKWQMMPVFWQVNTGTGEQAIDAALRFTNGDTFKPLPEYKVMGHHYHVGLVKRLKKLGGFDQRINDIATMKSIGVDIFSIIDGARGPGRHDKGELFLKDLEEYYDAARRQSDKDFLVMPNDENSTGGRPPFMGGHYDILFPKPVYWHPRGEKEEPFSVDHPKYGTVYSLKTPEDMMKMTELENVLISMPHPNTKRSTGYPESIKDEPQFLHQNYFALGYRWGMGIDASEKRLGEYRFLALWNETNNWMAKRGLPPKYAIAISEARSDKGSRGKPSWDDAYGMSPVNYLKIDSVPEIDDMSSVINALQKGEYFMTTGEVLIPNYTIDGKGNKRTIIADVEWTFPLDFVEIVWGDGDKTDREIISTSETKPFGKKRFEIPFNTKNKKWFRFAAWDVAGNGALVQPVSLIK